MITQRFSNRAVLYIEWSELLSWLWSPRRKRVMLLRKLVTHALVFHIWKNRNNLIHNQISATTSTVFQGIDREVRNIITARKNYKAFQRLRAFAPGSSHNFQKKKKLK
ncbi:hypothetical protein BRARA_E01917 [Brassica rapa]|uniref:Uncharacterized protein n=1 Tax=Brassica campestris TaxID=3711 RepID=A0A397ZBI3_BRACM|nr:hypothetical protein BRARA_E01917 [Brassica rapa]